MDNSVFEYYEEALIKLLKTAFQEDHIFQDITSICCIDQGAHAKANLLLKEKGIVSGLIFINTILQTYDSALSVELHTEDGIEYPEKTILATIEGPLLSILAIERLLLNFLQHLSGISTQTHKCVKLIRNTNCEILDTRKTLPGIRIFQKYAVKMGGGSNHRMNLEDQILIKNNHLHYLEKTHKHPVSYAVKKAKELYPDKFIEIEVQNEQMFMEAKAEKPNAILLDNMSCDEIKRCVELNFENIYLEASGGITLDNLLKYAQTGVNGVSMGALTHSVKGLDICLRIE
ncbi:MAG TPA: carboxylating nicotinate-nucleotide diphosphorylase [Chlamydiales bacterium]|nr:carboxylating nicotinate-nucleotide diphosphorylase [Chlamydiales bacterium]